MTAAPLDIARIRQIPSAELARLVADGLPGEAWRWVRDLRDEALRYYSTDAREARSIGRRAVELADLIGEPRAIGWGHRILAEALLYSGRMNEAEDEYALATAAWRRAKESAALGQLLVGRIHVATLLGRHDLVEELAAEARSLLEEAGDDLYLAKLGINLGNARFQRDRYNEALEAYEKGLSILDRIAERDETVLSVEVNRAVVLGHVDRDEEALELYEELESECKERELELLLAQIRMNAGDVHCLRSEFDRALHRLTEATDYFRKTDHPAFLGACLLNRAEVYYQLNLHHEANELASEAAEVFAGIGLTYDEALAQCQTAITALAMGEIRPALRQIRRARRLFDKDENAARSAYIRLIWAEALFLRQRYSESEQHVTEAIRRFRRLGLPRWEAASSVLLARLRVKRRRTKSPAGMLKRMLERLPRNLYPLQSYRLLEMLGEVLDEGGKKSEAERAYREALACLEDLRVRIPTEDSKLSFLQDKTHLYDRLIGLELSRRTPSVDRLFDAMERSRAQSLWDRLRNPNQYLTSDRNRSRMEAKSPEGDEELERARHRLSWLHTRLSRLELGTVGERTQAETLRGRLAEAEVAYSRLLRRYEERLPGRRAERMTNAGTEASAEPTPLELVRGRLPDGWGWVSYHVGPGFALAVIVTAAGTSWCRLADDLGTRVRGLCDRLDFQWGAAAMTSLRNHGAAATAVPPAPAGDATSDEAPLHANAAKSTHDLDSSGFGAGVGAPHTPGPPATNGASQPRTIDPMVLLGRSTDAILSELYSLLWEPIVRLGLPAVRGWIVSPHGPIHRVPLHALRGPDGYLIESGDVAVSPSARVFGQLPRAVPVREVRSAFVAGVLSSQLPAVETEVQHVVGHLRVPKTMAHLNPDRSDIFNHAPGAGIVHLAAHGSLRRDNPAYSFIELSDGPLYVHDLLHLQLPSSTVVLTACSSARGSAPAGDEWIGLARGFLQAGASTVIASLWPIQDEPTVELMDCFYEEFTSGLTAPEALGAAMRRLMRTRPHPWHWASFAVLGGVDQ
ncbi:MAG: CHAT domain-containing protein [Candidatus Eisenbacteria bacterium]